VNGHFQFVKAFSIGVGSLPDSIHYLC